MLIQNLRHNFKDKIMLAAAECRIRTVKVFGSTIRGDATEDSDVDFLISLQQGASLLDVGRFKWRLEEMLQKKVDIAFENKLHHSIASQVLKEAQFL